MSKYDKYKSGFADRVDAACESLKRFNSDWEYVDGFTHSDGKVNVRHKKCGHVKTVSLITARHKHCRCTYCYQKTIESNKEAQKRKHEAEAFRRELMRQANCYKGKQIELKVCQHCGAVFVDSKRKYCSDECTRAVTNKYYSVKKDRRRLAAFTIESKQITIPALYKRDNGVCWLCGGMCDINADPNDNTYPSIDHVQPISKGGLDTWENVRLAHRWCNSVKSDKNVTHIAPTSKIGA